MTDTTASKYGSDLIVDLLNRYDIPWVTLNPGSSYRGLHDSLVNYGDKRPGIILCQHEEIAVFMALGYAKATGKPIAAIVHDTVGLLHCTMAVYYAYLDRVPLLLLGATGPMDTTRRRPNIDWIHTSVLQSQPIRDYIKWDRQPGNAQDVVDTFARAYRVAMQEPQGPVYLCYDAAFQEDPLDDTVTIPDPARTGPGTRIHPDSLALTELADRLVSARNPVIVAGYLARHKPSFYMLVQLAEMLGAGVVDLGQRLNFPNRHPLNVSGIAKEALAEADLVLALDVKDLYGPLTRVDRITRQTEYITRPDCFVAEIGLRDLTISKWSEEFQQLTPVDLQIIADTAPALPELLARVEQRLGDDAEAQRRVRDRAARISEAHGAIRRRWANDSLQDWDAAPMTTARLASEIWSAIKAEDWVLTANTLDGWTHRLWDFDRPEQHGGASLGTSTQIGIALGMALAYKGTGKLVVDIQPDGDLMFDLGALWVAANAGLPMLVVMYNNRAYYNDLEHQVQIAEHRGRPVENAWVGQTIDAPAPDFAGVARSLGWYAEGPIEDPKLLSDALQRAIEAVKRGQPALLDTITRAR